MKIVLSASEAHRDCLHRSASRLFSLPHSISGGGQRYPMGIWLEKYAPDIQASHNTTLNADGKDAPEQRLRHGSTSAWVSQ